ncbi:hypothetical protein CDV36_012406 [Fusarium kuroshium]|uniref:Uncharacterized protein n=1 Tax=Fusarium kuroshium TaxID=2010991 RepID=A0A3M2RRZ9_9HYPO|nr:hypothetical protein CDV36_012406 [Fusarium kuroshium]
MTTSRKSERLTVNANMTRRESCNVGSTAGSSAGNLGLEIGQGRSPSPLWLQDMPKVEVMEHVAAGGEQRNVGGERRLTVVIPAYSTAQSEKVSLRIVNEVIVTCFRVRFRPRSAVWVGGQAG